MNGLWLNAYANAIDAFIPEMWAMEGVAILVENMVVANLVHRDFEEQFARFGQTVHTRKPAELVAKRKTSSDDVTVQDVSATDIAVKLDQHFHVSFLIRDGEETKSFKSLVDEYLNPAAIALARAVDKVTLAQYVQFIQNQAGSLGGLTSSNAVQTITNTGLVLNKNKAFPEGRQFIWSPDAEAVIVQNAVFHEADKRGDTEGLRTASIGRKLNFDHWMAQNMSQITSVNAGDAVTITADAVKGATSLALGAIATASVTKGTWLQVNGKVYQVAADATVTTNAATVTLTYGLLEEITTSDVGVLCAAPLVNNAGGYATGYAKYLTYDGTGTPQVGQGVTIGSSLTRYCIIDVSGSTILLDRPLEADVADNDKLNLMPEGGGYNFAFHKNALTLVIRPLALPRAGAGAVAGYASFKGVTMRVVITYDGTKQGHLVTLDFLAGIKVLDTALGAVALT